MISRRLHSAGWRFDCYFAATRYRTGTILRALERCGASSRIMRRVERNMLRNRMDTGFTYTNPYRRHVVMVVGRSSSGAEFINSFVHELRHLADDFARGNDIALDGEPIAYFSGDMAYALADVVCALGCDCCRNKARRKEVYYDA